MRKVPLGQSLQIIRQGSLNWRADRPIVVSFEVTDACTCFCKHCDHGGLRDMSRDMKPADYRRYMEVLKPVVVQVSGGEPLMRDDLSDVDPGDQPAERPAVHHPGVELVADDAGALPRAARGGRRPVLRQPRFPGRAARRLPRPRGPLRAPEPDRPGRREARLRRHLPEQLHHGGERGEINATADKAKEWGVNINYSAYSAAPHRLPRLLPDDARAAGDAARRAGAPEDPDRQPLGDQLGHDD